MLILVVRIIREKNVYRCGFAISALLPRSIVHSTRRKTVIPIKRVQLPFVPGSAFKTHKCQGQTLEKVVIDLMFPPDQKSKEVAMTYVSSSRFRRLTDVAFLRDFPLSSIQIKPNPSQMKELARLEGIDREAEESFLRSSANLRAWMERMVVYCSNDCLLSCQINHF